MDTIIPVITQLFTSMISYATSVVGFIMENPLVLMFVVLGFVGIGVGLVRRLIRL